GLGAAIDFLSEFSAQDLAGHERALLTHAHDVLGQIASLRILGPADLEQKGAIVSFTMGGTHPHDLAQLLDRPAWCGPRVDQVALSAPLPRTGGAAAGHPRSDRVPEWMTLSIARKSSTITIPLPTAD